MTKYIDLLQNRAAHYNNARTDGNQNKAIRDIFPSITEPDVLPKTEIVQVTPEMARELLTKNTRNRRINQVHVSSLVSIIKRGKWQFNGDAIRVSVSGVLLDGQHRLEAIVRSETPLQTVLVTNLPDEVFTTIDTGTRPRRAGDVLGISGENIPSDLAAVCNRMIAWTRYKDPSASIAKNFSTVDEVIAVLKDNPDLRAGAQYASGSSFCRRYLHKSIAAICYTIFSREDKKNTIEFFKQLETGAGLASDSPVLALRNRLINEASEKKTRMHIRYKTALIFKAFRLFRRGATVRALRVRTEGDSPEENIFQI